MREEINLVRNIFLMSPHRDNQEKRRVIFDLCVDDWATLLKLKHHWENIDNKSITISDTIRRSLREAAKSI